MWRIEEIREMIESYNKKAPTLIEAFLPIIFLVGLLALNVVFFNASATAGPNQIALITSGMLCTLIGLRLKTTWKQIEEGIIQSIGSAMPAILILLMIGALAGTWMISGIVPAMIYYGLKILNPSIFLVATCLICSLVSIATGSSWTTVATVGIALLGIGEVIGFPKPMIAGAIISGAYFGDKISPLSDTTNLAAAMAETNLYTHIRYMMLTTIPSYLITLILFLAIGFTYHATGNQNIASIETALNKTFTINPYLFLAPCFVIFLVIKRVNPFPALFLGMLSGTILAIIFQTPLIETLSGAPLSISSAYKILLKTVYTSNSIQTGHIALDNLLETHGMEGMLNTIWLILSAMIFGGAMEATGLLDKITEISLQWAQNTISLISSTVATCIFFNLTASDQYLSIIVPGRMFRKAYKDQNLAPQNLSRSLEDSGTVTSVLIPWNTCGATQSAVLGVSTLLYLPYCFFNLISPCMSIIFAVLNLKIARTKERLET